MKRILLTLFFVAASCSFTFAQYSQIYASEDVLFKEGVELFQQQKYAASYRCFQNYLTQIPVNKTTIIAETQYYLVANAYYMRSGYATDLLEEYITQYPYSPFLSEVRFMLGVLYVEKKRYKQAIREFADVNLRQISKTQQADFLFHQGYAYIQIEDLHKATTSFKNLLDSKTRYDISAKYYFAYCHYNLKNYSIALSHFLEIEHNPTYKNIVPYYLIQIYYTEQAYDLILERAETLLANNPNNENNAEVYRILGDIYYSRGNYELAIINLQNYEKSSTKLQREDMYMLGLSYYQTQEYKDAVKYLSMVTTQTDLLAENAYLHIGNAYIKLNDKNNARLAFGAAVATQLDPLVHEEALFNYALTTYETADAFGESITAFSEFLKQYPKSKYVEQAYTILVQVFMSTTDYLAAYNALNKINKPSVELLQTKSYLLYQLGNQAFAQSNFSQAILYFTEAMSLPSHKYLTECYFWRAESYYKQNDYEKAIADLNAYFAQQNVKRNINYILAHYSAGYAHFARNNYTQAQNYFLSYIAQTQEKDNIYADALNRVGDCYFYVRNFVQAESYYTKVIAMSGIGADYATFQRGCVLGLMKKYDDKIAVLEKLVKGYPKSDYADDALYEIARANLMKENENAAIMAYQRLLQTYPNSNWVRKSALEIGMVYYNMKQYDKTIEAYKKVINNYPGSSEAYTALEGLEMLYVETNQVQEYLAYIKTISKKVKFDTSTSREDSLTYIAAEHQYAMGNYKEAAQSLDSYITKFCLGGRYCTLAQYYLADSYYRLNEKTKALDAYRNLYEIQGNQYMEEACMRCAEISYDQQDYAYALTYFKKLQTIANSIENINIARLGILRCSQFLKDYDAIVDIATQIIDDARSDANVITEAYYNRSKAYLAKENYTLAIVDLQFVSEDLRTHIGAESKYLLANVYFLQNNMEQSENVIMDFATKNTPYQFWLARSFVLLADIYMRKGEDFQAKQYLLSVKGNYKEDDEIQSLISQRLELIAEREKERIN